MSQRSEKMGNLIKGSKRETKCFETISGAVRIVYGAVEFSAMKVLT